MTTAACSPASRSACVSPTQTIGGQAGLQRRFRLGADERVGLVMERATLGMADDDVGRARVLEHRGGNVAGEGAARLRMAVLGAEARARRP